MIILIDRLLIVLELAVGLAVGWFLLRVWYFAVIEAWFGTALAIQEFSRGRRTWIR